MSLSQHPEAVRARSRRSKARNEAPRASQGHFQRPETRLIVPDAHVPYHDRKAWGILLSVAKDLRPDRCIVMGDFLDCLSLSSHPKTKPDVVKFAEELAAGNAALDQLQAALPDGCDIKYLGGNHDESRAARFEAENGNLENILSVRKHLKIEERGIEWISLRRQDNYAIGPVAYLHGISESKNNAAVHAEQFAPRIGKRHVVFAHMHSDQRFTSHAGFTAQCCGFLGDEYDGAFGYRKGRPAPWTLGFLIQTVYGDCVTDTFVRVRNGTACFNGRVYQ